MNDTTNEIPYGYCHCGCGGKTKIAPKNRKEAGWIKGEPLRYIHRHAQTGTAPKVNPNPSGLCMCGCGEPAPIAKRTNTKLGHVRGQPARFILGHALNLRIIRPLADRFWEKVDKRGPDECWDWQGAGDQHGYGQLHVNGRTTRAHRVAYELTYGPIPDGLDILHKCDRPACNNPRHLFAGTAHDNVHDMIKKGRGSAPPRNNVKGEKNGHALFDEAQIIEFRRQYAELGISIRKFAAMHGVVYMTMYQIITRKSWSHI